jgi:hypothetical protein
VFFSMCLISIQILTNRIICLERKGNYNRNIASEQKVSVNFIHVSGATCLK